MTVRGLSPGRLLALVAADLPGHRLEVGAAGDVRFVPIGEGPVLMVGTRVEKRFLGRTEVAVFRTEIPDPTRVPGRFKVRHVGNRKRTGVEIRGGGRETGESLERDDGFVNATIPLDFKRFELISDGKTLTAMVELVGASYVAIAFPPMRSYVRLFPDQRDALIATFEALKRVVTSLGNG